MEHPNNYRYHPLYCLGRKNKSARKVETRWRAICALYDFKDKEVLDLGCSGGYFSFEASKVAKNVTAVDADNTIISENKILAVKYGFHNVNFIHAVISPEVINTFPHYDVTLFLSVLHHVMAVSDRYPWNRQKNGYEYGLEILTSLIKKTDVLIFEMGQSNESFEWAKKLPKMLPSPDTWIVKNLLRPAGFDAVEIISPPEYRGLSGRIKRLIHDHFNQTASGTSLLGKIIRRTIGYDTRDCRFIFIAFNKQNA